MPFEGLQTRVGVWGLETTYSMGVTLALTNMIERPVRGGNAASCQITMTTCLKNTSTTTRFASVTTDELN